MKSTIIIAISIAIVCMIDPTQACQSSTDSGISGSATQKWIMLQLLQKQHLKLQQLQLQQLPQRPTIDLDYSLAYLDNKSSFN